MRIVQVGACKGHDHVYNFVSDLIDSQSIPDYSFLLLVEPMEFHQEDLHTCYKVFKHSISIRYEQCCIVPQSLADTDANAIIYYSENDAPEYQVSSINKQHILKHGYKEESIKSFVVPQISLETLMNRYNLTELDYLFLDIEGIDADVILSFDLSKYEIQNIQIEHLHLGANTDAVKQKFFDAGYRIVEAIGGIGFDTLFTK